MITTNREFKRRSWSQRMIEIRENASNRLIQSSIHAKQKMNDRDIDLFKIYDVLRSEHAEIIQCHQKNSYRHNKDELYVVWGTINDEVIHIVLANPEPNKYNLVTAYKPSTFVFGDNGKTYISLNYASA